MVEDVVVAEAFQREGGAGLAEANGLVGDEAGGDEEEKGGEENQGNKESGDGHVVGFLNYINGNR